MDNKLTIEQKRQIELQTKNCKICREYKGWIKEVRNGEGIVRPCSCTILKVEVQDVKEITKPYADH